MAKASRSALSFFALIPSALSPDASAFLVPARMRCLGSAGAAGLLPAMTRAFLAGGREPPVPSSDLLVFPLPLGPLLVSACSPSPLGASSVSMSSAGTWLGAYSCPAASPPSPFTPCSAGCASLKAPTASAWGILNRKWLYLSSSKLFSAAASSAAASADPAPDLVRLFVAFGWVGTMGGGRLQGGALSTQRKLIRAMSTSRAAWRASCSEHSMRPAMALANCSYVIRPCSSISSPTCSARTPCSSRRCSRMRGRLRICRMTSTLGSYMATGGFAFLAFSSSLWVYTEA
mmetsp:Transcript_6773/g.18177  ORF Transcript_6773/g.18177 Transcript_6773/m.18177 type:complete len:289 (-) Transcript_6773:460-1326(-)